MDGADNELRSSCAAAASTCEAGAARCGRCGAVGAVDADGALWRRGRRHAAAAKAGVQARGGDIGARGAAGRCAVGAVQVYEPSRPVVLLAASVLCGGRVRVRVQPSAFMKLGVHAA